jgi:hypothetical protein
MKESIMRTALCALMFLLIPAAAALGGFKVEEIKPPDGKVPDSKKLAAPIPEADKKLPQNEDFIVHEWGTFTSFSGSDGIALDFRPLVDEDLPKFVMDRPRQTALNQRREIAYATGRGEKGLVISKQRMETPVTYFYSDQERLVDVMVEFPHGLLTEFFPPVRQFGPAYKKDSREPLENSWLRWGKIRLLPQPKLDKEGIDPCIWKVPPDQNDRYAYARETDSTTLQITDPTTFTTYHEKFLFYRGVGNFNLPVALKSSGGGRFVLTNSGKTPLHYAFLVQIDNGAVRFARYDQIGQSVEMALPSESASLDALSEAMVQALVSDGLFDKEARAMVKTWKSSWFGEEGTRVLYSLPQAETDSLLPLHLQPQPRELVRVMVGRLETLTPEQEIRIEGLVSRLGAADPAVRDQTSAEIKKLGRFAEPALTRIATTSTDPEAQTKAQTLLHEILVKKGIPSDRKDQK